MLTEVQRHEQELQENLLQSNDLDFMFDDEKNTERFTKGRQSAING